MSESISGTILPFYFRLNHHVNCYNRFFVLFCPNHVPPSLKPLKTARATSEYLLSTSACTCQVWCKACAHATLHASAGHALLTCWTCAARQVLRSFACHALPRESDGLATRFDIFLQPYLAFNVHHHCTFRLSWHGMVQNTKTMSWPMLLVKDLTLR
ncbi:unnamed protein product [Prunus armeniaca]